jgi:hypothetical protein
MSELIRVSHGVWRPPELLADLSGRAAAALAACPDGTVVAGITAGRLHGLWLPDRPDLPGAPDLPVEVIVHRELPVPSSRPGSRRSEVRARRRVLRTDEIEYVDGIPVTTAARTWVDLADRLRMPDLVAAGDCALRGDTTMDDLVEVVARATHRRGVVRARAALPLLDRRSRSRPESHLRYALLAAGLPAPDVNEPIFAASGEWLAEPDLSYDDVRLALEYNGADHAEAKRMRRDITREFDIEERGGWRTLTVGPAEVFGKPDLVATLVRRLRRERLRRERLRSGTGRRRAG